MTPLLFVLLVVAISFIAGVLGSLLGLGGGMIVVPALTLLLGVDIRLAIGASRSGRSSARSPARTSPTSCIRGGSSCCSE